MTPQNVEIEPETVEVPKALLKQMLDRLDALEARQRGAAGEDSRNRAEHKPLGEGNCDGAASEERADLKAELDRVNQDLAAERKRTAELEERLDAVEARSQQADDSADESGSSTPMHQLIEAGEAGVLGHVTASVRRAKTIAEHFGRWAKRTPKGLVVGDDVKRLLETATGERLEWSQINRARRTLAEMTKGTIAAKKRKGDWILVAQPDDHRLRPLLARGG